MENKNRLVVVLSRNYSTGLSVVRSLGSAGYTVDLVASSYAAGNSRIVACSKYVRNAVEVVTQNVKQGEEDQELLNALLGYKNKNQEKPVLFPTDDYTTSVMDLHRDVLDEIFIMPTIVGGGNGCMTARMSKTFQSDLARKAGLLTPQEWIIPLDGGIEIPEDMVYPCFVKPMESVSGYKKEMAKCTDEEQLIQHLYKLQDRFAERSVLVQEYLQIDNEIDFSGVCLDQEIIIPAIIKKWNVAKYERGVTLSGKVVPTEELGDLYDKIVNMLQEFHYVGMFDMELNIVGDKIYFNEVNLRSGGPNFSYFRSGVNLPALFVKEALGEKHTAQDASVAEFGKTFIYEKVAWEDHLHGYMSKQELKDRISGADITLLHYDQDPTPSKYFMRTMRRATVKQNLKQNKRNLKRSLNNFKKRLRQLAKDLSQDFKPLLDVLRTVKGSMLGLPQYDRKNRRDPYSKTPRVLIAGRNFSSNLTMARSVGMAGYEAEVLRIFQKKPKITSLSRYLKPDAYSMHIKAYHVCVSGRKADRIVRALIRVADPYRKMLLIPADDLVANIADENLDVLSQYYIMPNVSGIQGEISRLMSKDVQKELAREAHLPIVNSCVIRTHNGRFEIPETVTYPCFIKPNISKNSSKSRMRKCEDRDELVQTLTEFSKRKDIEMLVEDFIQIDKEYAILGLSTKQGVVSPGFFVAEEGGHDAHRGVAMTGRILPTSEAQELIDDLTKFMTTLNFEGLFDVDLIMTPDGKMYFTELNLRFGASGYAVTLSGVNLPGMFADYMLKGKPIDLHCKISEPGKRFISEKIMLDEYISGYLTKADMKERMDSMDIHFIDSDEEHKAYRHFKRYYAYAGLIRWAKARKTSSAEQD